MMHIRMCDVQSCKFFLEEALLRCSDGVIIGKSYRSLEPRNYFINPMLPQKGHDFTN